MLRIVTILLAGTALGSSVSAQVGDEAAKGSDGFGVLVMAHGGGESWNEGVLSAVEPLRDSYPVEVAFGMADAVSIQEGVGRLEAGGADRIVVVRLFISGESWHERTRQILGVEPGAPMRPAPDDRPESAGHGMSMQFWRIDTDASFSVSVEGLAEAEEMGRVLADRARALSVNPAEEDVLILAHGPADDAENRRWLAHMRAHAEDVREALPFHDVAVETLREDWPEKREQAEARIREYLAKANGEGRQVIVLPFRVHGFGPYEQVLEGFDYRADGRGLVPHEQVTAWIERQIDVLGRQLAGPE